MPIIKIPGTGIQPLSINGIKRDVPRGTEQAVDADQLSALRDSHVSFTVIDAKKGGAPKASANADLSGVQNEQTPGGDHLPTADPAPIASVVVPGPEVKQEPGADALATETEDEAREREAKAREDATDAALAAAAGETPPVEVLTNADPNQDGVEAGTFDPNAVLNGSAANVTGQLDGFSAEQIATLIATEKKGKNRSGLLAALEAKLA